MHEIELRFHVPAGACERLRRFIDEPTPAPRLPLAALYYDSADRQLARAGIGLRLRREGERWVQTVKGPTADGISRLEHNAVLPAGSAPALDLRRHAGHPLGDALTPLAVELRPVFGTEILRATRRLRLPGAEIELAWDEGRLIAGQRALPVHELELELIEGSVNALLAYAHGLVTQLPLSLDLRSKAERGERLAAGQRQSPPRPAVPLRLPAGATPAQLAELLRRGFAPIAANASQIGSGDSGEGHGQALAVGLSRLSTALRPATRLVDAAAAAGADAGAFHRFTAVLDAWCHQATPPPATATLAARGVRQAGVQQWLIECLGWQHQLARVSPSSA